MDLVVNSVVCQGRYSCATVIPDILLPGQTLTIHDPVGSETLTGRNEP
ncbi:DddA-like double-stranded DNA deaminase toxin [Saccharothrix violaceirubra]|uniref:Uncharacterized protein n=1 Tax=Saccharothrix violaceirubra TaxID=413306 RepID=A0A7W7WTS8_9PSEU|nr:hypothetical protein [Saccharothrix violaceirubra]